MPNSSGGQQEVRQQEGEEEEVGEFWQQDEERVVKRRITVSMRPISRGISVKSNAVVQLLVKVNTMEVASEKRVLRQVAFMEKVISTSLCEF